MSIDDVECPFCWDTGVVTVMEPAPTDDDVEPIAVIRPCPEGCMAPDEVPF